MNFVHMLSHTRSDDQHQRRNTMSLKIIGSGFDCTSTMSTKIALEQLGYGPCHHMVVVMGNPDQPAHWQAHPAGEEVNWAAVFAGYEAQVDFPGASV